MAKRKLARFAENKTLTNLIQPKFDEVFNADFHLKGKWNDDFFKNKNDIVLELGCGKGEYSVGMAKHFPNKNFLGIDIKGARLWYGAKQSEVENIRNCGFLRTRIDFITSFFAKDEVSEIWLTFPDPQKESRRERKRLTSQMFIERYRQFLKKNGIIHLKTDSDELFEYTLNEIEKNSYKLVFHTFDLYNDLQENFDEATPEILNIETHYEKLFKSKGKTIKYLKFGV